MRDGLDEEMIAGIESAVEEALNELETMRAREGQSLTLEMQRRLDEIARHVPVIENAAESLVEAYRSRLQKRVAEIVARDGHQ